MDALLPILQHTPRWVFALFIGLVAIGLRQSLPGQSSLRRVALLPLAMALLSLAGVVSAFSTQPLAFAAWLAAAGTLAAWLAMRPVPAGTRFDPSSGRFLLPGSLVPLALLLGVFLARYVVGAALAMHPQWSHDAVAALLVGSLTGALSGLFLGRAVRLWRLALRTVRPAAAIAAPL